MRAGFPYYASILAPRGPSRGSYRDAALCGSEGRAVSLSVTLKKHDIYAQEAPHP